MLQDVELEEGPRATLAQRRATASGAIADHLVLNEVGTRPAAAAASASTNGSGSTATLDDDEDRVLDGDELVRKNSLRARSKLWDAMCFKLTSLPKVAILCCCIRRFRTKATTRQWEEFDDAFRKWLKTAIWSPVLFALTLLVAGFFVWQIAAWRQHTLVDWDVRQCMAKLNDNPGWEFWREGNVICSRDANQRIVSFRDVVIDWPRTLKTASATIVSFSTDYCAGRSTEHRQSLTLLGHVYIHHADQTSHESVLVTAPRVYHLFIALRYPSLVDYCRPANERPPVDWPDMAIAGM